MKKEVLEIIDKQIQYIWKNKISADYENGWLLKEDTLKNALYHHIRTELSSLFDAENIRVFTEFRDSVFKGTSYIPDMVIATVDLDNDSNYYGDSIKEILAIIEIKYKTGFNSSNNIYLDYEKLRKYIDELDYNGNLYMATLWEYEDDETNWVRKNASWASGRLTELNASYKRGSDYKMNFYIYTH